jgi:hypothetical protein
MPYWCDGCLNHNLLDGIAGGQGRFCSKYLLSVNLEFKDINNHVVRLLDVHNEKDVRRIFAISLTLPRKAYQV